MSSTILGWLLIVSSFAIAAPALLQLRSRGRRKERGDLESCKARLEEIGARLKLGTLTETEADAARLALLSQPLPSEPLFTRPPSPNLASVQGLRGNAGTAIVAGAVFLLVAGIGAASSYMGADPEATGTEDTNAGSPSHSGPDGAMLASLEDYSRSVGGDGSPGAPAGGEMLPDVNRMIEQLAARLETAPGDVKGWRMLGWSYFNTARYEEAAAAYAKALELDPSSAELKRAHEDAKAKASGGGSPETGSPPLAEASGAADHRSGVETMPGSVAAASPSATDEAIRSMVDGLAARLASAPRDVEGWARLMRSRVVLGEKGVAAEALRKALDVFKDDSAASGKITEAAIALGLKAE